MTPISIIRHSKERRSKCSLTPLEGRADISYYKAREGWSFDVTGFTVLALGAQELSADDAGRPLVLLDSTWRLLPQLEACLNGSCVFAICYKTFTKEYLRGKHWGYGWVVWILQSD